jgi:hypothetical protein
LNGDRIKKIVAIATELADSSNGIHYTNYLDDPRFGKLDFYDADHLNHDGAKKLTEIISRSLEDWESSGETVKPNNRRKK